MDTADTKCPDCGYSPCYCECDECGETPCVCKDKSVNLLDFFLFNGQQFYPKPNIVDQLEGNVLDKIARRVVDGAADDDQSMSIWKKGVQNGLDLCKQETEPRSTPWQGACNYKSPTLAKAALQFSDRTTTELLRQRDLVQINVVGKDDSNEKQERADRVAIYENWQINENMKEWRNEHEKVMYLLPYHGTVFKKIYFDPTLGRNVCDIVTYPNFIVDNTATSLERLRRFSEPFSLPKNRVLEKIKAGVWTDTGISYGDMNDDSENTNAEQPSNSEQDKMTSFIEQQCFYDLDDDGYEEPYTVVVQPSTYKVVRVSPRYEIADVMVRVNGDEVSLADTDGEYDSVMRIDANTNLVMYGMEHDAQGGLLFEGYGHILSALTQAINTTTNQLIDAGSLANTPCGWLAKGFRAKLGDLSFAPGEFKQSGLGAQELQSGIMLHPSKEPSSVLYQLRNDLITASNEYSASADLSQSLSPQAPAATTLALVQEKQLSSAAIILRIYRTMAQEFKILYDLDSKYLDINEYKRIVDDEKASEMDFMRAGIDIVPSANPEISSRMMRIQQANAELANLETILAAGGNVRPLLKGYFEAIGSLYTDEVFPEETPEEQLMALVERNPELNDMIMQAREQTQALTKKQAEGLEAQNKVLLAQAADLEAKAKEKLITIDSLVHSTAADLDKKEAEIAKIKSDTILNLEKAESESVKNNIDKYTYASGLDKEGMEEDEEYEGYEGEEPVVKTVINKETGATHIATLNPGAKEWDISPPQTVAS